MIRTMARVTCLLMAVLFLIGCGSKTAQVDGTIVFSDAPDRPATDLEGYTITFESVEEKTSCVGTVDKNGKFKMNTFKEGDGALKGKLKVAVTPPIQLSDSSLAPSKIDARYQNFETSGLDVEIVPGVNPVTIKVDRKAK